MKTAVSIPDDLFARADELARQERCSRSALYAAALREYVARRGTDEVTTAMNRVCEDLGNDTDGLGRAAARHVLERSEW